MKSLITTLKLTFLAALIAGSPILFSGCGGGGATFQTSGNQTLGKELQDLDDAYKKRLLSEKEYKEARKNLMNKYND